MQFFLKTKNRTIEISTSKAKVLQKKGFNVVDKSGKKAKNIEAKNLETK